MKTIIFAIIACLLHSCQFYSLEDYQQNTEQKPSVKEHVVNGKFIHPTNKFNFPVPAVILSNPNFKARDSSITTVENGKKRTTILIEFSSGGNVFGAGLRPWLPDEARPEAKQDYLAWTLSKVDSFKGQIITTEFREDIYFRHQFENDMTMPTGKSVVGHLLILKDEGVLFLVLSTSSDKPHYEYFCNSQNMLNYLIQAADTIEIKE